MQLVFYAALCLLSGCSSTRLSVRLDEIDHCYLASTHVNTPDVRRIYPFCGQQLLVSWSLPDSYRAYENLHLRIFVRLRNAEMRRLRVPLKTLEGGYTYRLMNEEYWRTCGILTYRVVICDGSTVLDAWTHQVWASLIDLKMENE